MGIWIGNGDGLAPIALTQVSGDLGPQLGSDLVFHHFGSMVMNRRLTVFHSRIGSAGGSSLRSGLWEYNNGNLLQLLSVGDEIQVETELGTSEKTISAFDWSPTEGVDREHRQLAVGLSFVEGGSGVFLIVPLDDSIIPGDFNKDGAVDAADFVEWQQN